MTATTVPTLAKNAVFIANRQPVTTSQAIAEAFGKRHDNVLQAIHNLEAPKEFIALNFKGYSYTAANGKENPAYTVTRDGFFMLAMGFTGKQAALFKVAFIEAFNRLEQELKKAQKQTASRAKWKQFPTDVLAEAFKQCAPIGCKTKGISRAEIIRMLDFQHETPETVGNMIYAVRRKGGKWMKYSVYMNEEQSKGATK